MIALLALTYGLLHLQRALASSSRAARWGLLAAPFLVMLVGARTLGVAPPLAALGGVTARYLGAVVPGALVALVLALALRMMLARRRRSTGLEPPAAPTASSVVDTWSRFRKHRLAVTSACVLGVLVEVALLAGLVEQLLGVSHEGTDLAHRYGPYGWPHPLGTDDLGRDVLVRLLFGGQISLAVGVIAALSSAVIGTAVGLLAGWYGGRLDALLMRFTDAMLGVPVLPLMIVLSAIDLAKVFAGGAQGGFAASILALGLGIAALAHLLPRARSGRSRAPPPTRAWAWIVLALLVVAVYWSLWESMAQARVLEGNFASVVKIILIITLFGWMTVARLARAAALQIRELDYVAAARALGASDLRIMLRHILPNALAPIVVAATLEVGSNILYEAALSFLGLGIQPPVPSWGNMLNNALDYIKREPLLAFWPGALTLVCVTCFNFVGDGLRDALDPHMVIKLD